MKTSSLACPIEDLAAATTEGLFDFARRFVDGRRPGVLSTVDAEGAPHSRWMATTTAERLPFILTLTAAGSAKVRQIRSNPNVSWLFSNEDFSLVLNLRGRATIHVDTPTVKRAWNAIPEKDRPYFLSDPGPKPAIAVIETLVDQLDFAAPESGRRVRRIVGSDAASSRAQRHDPPAPGGSAVA